MKNKTPKSPLAQQQNAKRSLQAVVGQLGEFQDSLGRICGCRVLGIDERGHMLRIQYWSREAGRVSEGFIGTDDFRPDEPPNLKLSGGGPQPSTNTETATPPSDPARG